VTAPPLGVGWQLSTRTGWGNFGVNFACEAYRSGRVIPVFMLASSPSLDALPEDQRRTLAPILQASNQFLAAMSGHPGSATVSFPVLAASNVDFVTQVARSSTANHAMTFQETTVLSHRGLERARSFDTIVAGSSWLGDVLRAYGLDNVKTVLQGIDPRRFRPNPDGHPRDGRFRIFSGGKMEYRKGQDIVIAAFRAFQRRHPDALLCFCWDNIYPGDSATIARGGLVEAPPEVTEGTRDEVARWLSDNGLPADTFRNIGMVPNREMPDILTTMDAAIFPNRCEGGTNLVAMEAMACGVPTILSVNTGHRDLIADRNCYPLTRQGPVAWSPTDGTTRQWGESSVDEVVETLEAIYRDRAEARRRAARGAATLAELTWQRQTVKLLDAIGC
jgi:glycosyltransferase involved in cell wall biosynthesis